MRSYIGDWINFQEMNQDSKRKMQVIRQQSAKDPAIFVRYLNVKGFSWNRFLGGKDIATEDVETQTIFHLGSSM